MMTLEEQKLAVCEKLPNLIETEPKHTLTNKPTGKCWMRWKSSRSEIHWPTEGLQICHEAEKLLDKTQFVIYLETLKTLPSLINTYRTHSATYEQRLEALYRVWFPGRFSK